MREFSTPMTAAAPEQGNLSDPVFAHAHDDPDAILFSRQVAGRWLPVTAREFADEVRGVAKGLIAAGIGSGDRIGLMSRTRYEWTVFDYAIWTAGAVSVPIYDTSSTDQVLWYLGDSGAAAAIAETAEHVAIVEAAREELPGVKQLWQISGGAIETLTEAGAGIDDDAVAERRSIAGPDSLATIIYTSGTTGQPKGCALTHGNFMFDVASTSGGMRELFNEEEATLLFMTLAHVFARLIQCGCVTNKVRMGHTTDTTRLLEDLAEFRPTFVLSIPRVFEKVFNGARQKAHDQGGPTGRIFDQAEATAVAYSQALDRGRPGPGLRLRHAAFDRLVYGKLRAALGGRVRYAVSGGAPLGERLGHFFRGVGVTILEGYGLTETTAAATVNLPDAVRVGTVGPPIPGTSVRIDDDGEVLIRGGHVFRAYWRNEAATRETLDADGWLRTGDVGNLDDDGYLRVTGRKKEILVTSGGKNVAPAVLENRLRAHPLISQCVVVGDRRPFVAALITLDPEALPRWKSLHDKPESATFEDLRKDPDVLADLQAAVDDTNTAVSRAESIRKFTVLPVDFTVEDGQLTPTLKVKRPVIADEFADEIEALYR